MMNCKVMVVEDEIFVATEIESMLEELGHQPIGIAMDSASALDLARHAEIALVDLNLRDGPTGPSLGKILAEQFGVTVLFITANPSQLGDGVPGTIGVLPKPVMDEELSEAVRYAVARRHRLAAEPPTRLKLFGADNCNEREDGLGVTA
ncbi:response regulator [Aminobacter sp. BA135]|uniref:response regulator n=1 Tax=Aminobacter sp. BA135 TaxID=537596 RepID=UPI003D7A75BA